MARAATPLVEASAVGVRASDEDRERVASEVREHFALGRIDGDELDRRLGRAYVATTVEELRALRADLPGLRAGSMRAAALDRVRRLAPGAGVALLPFSACVLVWLATGAQGGFWPMWVGLVGILRLLRRGKPIRVP